MAKQLATAPGRGRPAFLTRLKAETAEQHERLEAQVDLLSPDLTLKRYESLLKGMFGFYAPVEARLMSAPEWSSYAFDISARQKLPRLRQDLIALGMTEREINGMRLCPDLPALDSFTRLLGCMYVLEGATLGGQIITRHIGKTLARGPGDGVAFFASYGPNVGPMWQEFCAFLASEAASKEAADVIVANARETFVKLEQWLRREVVI